MLLAMHMLLSFAIVSCAALTFAAPYRSKINIPLHPLYHYCSPPTGLSTSHSTASSWASSLCAAAASTYHPNNYGEVEIRQDDGLFLRAWWDASEAKKTSFKDECVEAVEKVVRGCQHEGHEERFYGGISEFAGMGGRIEVGFE